MKKINFVGLLFIMFTIYIVNANYLEISKYPGKHDNNCNFNTKMTGNIIKNKIYVFGGCYPFSNMININIDDNFNNIFGKKNKNNVTDEGYVYYIDEDKWVFETYTPMPMVSSSTITINEDIYFFNIKWNNTQNSILNDMWVYNTISKKWIQKEDLPFIWYGNLIAEKIDENIYFMGSRDGTKKNIIHIYNSKLDIWEKPIILKKRFFAYYMIYRNDILYFLGKEINNNKEINSYGGLKDGIITINSDMSYNFSPLKMNFDDVSISNIDNYIYVIGDSHSYGNNVNITRINLEACTKKNMGSLPSPVKNPLSLSYKKSIFLFGGKIDKLLNSCDIFDEDCVDDKDNGNMTKILHHKFMPNKINNDIKFKIQN